MDDAQADHLWYASLTGRKKPELRRRAQGTRRSVWREPTSIVHLVQILVVVAIILPENAEDRCGVGFPVNSTWTGVSRS